MNPIPVPLTSTITAACPELSTVRFTATGAPFPSTAADSHPPGTQNPEEVESAAGTDESNNPCGAQPGENIVEAILNGAKPHRAPRRHRHHWAPFARSISKPAVFEEDTVDDIYEIIERGGRGGGLRNNRVRAERGEQRHLRRAQLRGHRCHNVRLEGGRS